jgi:hypothetical protein
VSADPSIVTIADDGNLLPGAFGSTTVTATYDGGVSTEIDVSVSGATVPVAAAAKRKGKLKRKAKRPADFVFLSGPSFDPADIDPDTVLVGGVAPVKVRRKDVNDDGVADLIAYVRPRDLALQPGPASVRMFATMTDGGRVAGAAAATVR